MGVMRTWRSSSTEAFDVNHANHRGDTALTIAASRGDVKLLELLLKRGERGAARRAQGHRAHPRRALP